MHGSGGNAEVMIRLEGIGKTYPDGTVAVGELTLDVPRGQLVALVGPSGCGKTTTLRMINRLTEPSRGRIILDGSDVTHADPVQLRRGMGYVIQQVGLFPHRRIRDNVATVPALLGWSAQRSRRRADELLELVGLDPAVFGSRYPAQLSGGQRQRVGVARALAADPPVLLMDEPFSAVDPIARDQLQQELLRIQREVVKTIVLVTHDIDEAVLLADRIAVLSTEGRLEQYDTPAAVLGGPANAFVSGFVGAERGLRLLGVTGINLRSLAPVRDGESAWVYADASLKQVLALVLQQDSGSVTVRERGTERELGSLDVAGVHTMARGSGVTAGT